MEAWFRLSVFYKTSFDKELDRLREFINKDKPYLKINDNEFNQLKYFLSNLIKTKLVEAVLSDYEQIINALDVSIKDIASEDPLLAYKLNIGRDIYKAQSYLHGFLSDLEQHETIAQPLNQGIMPASAFKSVASEQQNKEIIKIVKEIELNLITLSTSIGLMTRIKTKNIIEKRIIAMETIDEQLYEEFKTNFINVHKSLSNIVNVK